MLRRSFLAATTAPLLSAATTSSAVQLGYGPDDKLLMVHADDAGMCHSVNLATWKALEGGLVHSASIMVPCPWFPEMADWAKTHTSMDLGVHLTLTSEWKHYRWRPVAPPDQVKGLLDPDGFLWRDVRSAAQHATPREVEIECRAQIERARQFGVAFTHLDTHMGTLYARPDYFDVYTKLALEYKVPCMIVRPENAQLDGYPITAAMLTQKIAAGHAPLDRLVTGVPGRAVDDRRASYVEFLRALQPGVTKLIVHLALEDAEIQAVTGNWRTRWADYSFFTSAECRTLMAQLGIRGVTYRELGKLLRVGR